MRKFVLPLLALGALGFALMHVVKAAQQPADPPPPVEPPRSPFGRTVAGAGLVEPETENIAIGSPLPGVVVEVFVKPGKKVKAGDKLFRIDDRALVAEKGMREAMLHLARAKLNRLEAMPRPEELPGAAARVREAEANVSREFDQLKRLERLLPTRSASEEEYTARKMMYQMAREQLAKAKADESLLKAGAWKPEIDIARAELAQAEAQLKQTATELDRLVVRASVTGEILQVNVRPGEFVAASAEKALVIMGGTDNLHLRADIDENDLARFRVDAAGYASLRGAPDKKFKLHFVRVEPFVVPKRSLTGVSTERVDTRVLQVIYRIEAGESRLYVGQQMDVFVEAP